jgi:DNA-directed RNA polymerase specialized sigma24 family protein
MPDTTSHLANESDRTLMVRAHEGDQPAMAALLDRYLGPLYNLVLRATGERGLAADVVRDCLAARLRGLAGRVPPAEERWFVELARDAYRALPEAGLPVRAPGQPLRISPRHWATEHLRLVEEEQKNVQRFGQRLRRRLWRAWSQLTVEQRFVLALAETQPLAPEDLGRVLGQSSSVARNIRDEAKLALMARLANPEKHSWRSLGRHARRPVDEGGRP